VERIFCPNIERDSVTRWIIFGKFKHFKAFQKLFTVVSSTVSNNNLSICFFEISEGTFLKMLTDSFLRISVLFYRITGGFLYAFFGSKPPLRGL